VSGSRRHRTGLVHQAPKKGADVRCDINVTPLVDVCLVLLIIFMVVTPMLSRGKEVALPKTKNFNEKRDLGEQPIVSVSIVQGKAVYWFDKEKVEAKGDSPADEQLKKRTQEALGKLAQKNSPIRTIFVKADGNLKFRQVYPALMAIHEAGSDGVELGVNERKE